MKIHFRENRVNARVIAKTRVFEKGIRVNANKREFPRVNARVYVKTRVSVKGIRVNANLSTSTFNNTKYLF